MNETMQKELLARLDSVLEKLGIAGGYTWDLLVRKAYLVDGWLTVGAGLGMLLGSIMVVRLGGRYFSQNNPMEADSPGPAIGCVFGGIAVVLGVLASFILLFDGVAHILIPEIYALEQILELLGN